ncbi:uncharacterized protein A1O5_01610 [Cladophialophora psammophila CBS 110553]|uniref:Transcription factor domain-containing protein n=1 Tax=Cladophialophora psammophila CBS 110553 TaxID=1182543 RepID=W9XXC8_9EURO|nr:uncharacterized protein A1O5_01610 [Cladophialophora psammophila CBS 110553]EXJ74914.1 hypothetical protein A1O5_01610 [Cladophialophora psammophila CBS 110553]
MQSNKPSVIVPDVLWLNAKTPSNFKSTSDYEQKSIIAVRAQHYSAKKRVEQASSLFELQKYGPQLLPERSSDGRVSAIQPCMSTKLRLPMQNPFESQGKVPSETSQIEDTDKHHVLEGKRRRLFHRKAIKRPLQPQQRARSTRAIGVLSVGKGRSLSMLLQGGSSDPFSSTPIPLSALRYSVISTIQPISLRTIWADEVGTPNAVRVLIPAQKRVYKTYLNHEAVMHALFAYCWSVMGRLHPHKKDLYYRYALDHEVRGIRGLQPLVVSESNKSEELDVAVRVVLLFCCASVFRSRLDALFLHLHGLKQLIQSMGGVDRLHWIRKEIIIYLVVRAAATTRTRTVLDPSSWDPGWWWDRDHCDQPRDLVTNQEDSSHLAPGLSSPKPDDFSCIFMTLRELVEVENLKKRMADDRLAQINRLFRWSQLRRQAVRARILNYWCDLTEPTKAVEPCPGSATPTTVHHASIKMCLCLALQLFIAFGLEASLLRQSWLSTIQVWHVMLLRCVRKLEFDLDKIDQSHPGALDLLWVCGIGAYVEQVSLTHVLRNKPTFWMLYTADQVDVRWFSVRFGILARSFGYRQYQDVALLFEKRYVHISSLQDPALSKIFEFDC